MPTLHEMFDYQKFAGNSRLNDLIKDTESRYSSRLSLDDLELISAAGSPDMVRKQKDLLNQDKKD